MELHGSLNGFITLYVYMSMKLRPNRISLLALGILGLSLWNGLRFVQAILNWPISVEFQSEPGPIYLAISGGFWLLAGLYIFRGLWQGKAWAWYASLGGSAGYGVWYWFDRLVLQKPHANWPFGLSITIVILLLILLILLSPRTRKYFSKR